jgi:hypothetical protein
MEAVVVLVMIQVFLQVRVPQVPNLVELTLAPHRYQLILKIRITGDLSKLLIAMALSTVNLNSDQKSGHN